MKKLVFFILVLLLVRGVTFSAFGANGRLLQYENLLMGTEIGNTGNLNQVLAVLVVNRSDAALPAKTPFA